MGSSDDDNNLTSDLTKLYNMVFNKSTLLLIIWFLALHFVCYRLLKFFFSENLDTLDYQSKLSRMLDIAVFSFLLLFLMASYYSVPDAGKGVMLENLADYFKSYIDDKDSIYKTVVFLLLFYCAIYLFRIPMNMETKPTFISCAEFGAWTLFLIIIFVKFFNDVFGFSMMDIIYSFFDWSTLPDVSNETNPVKISQVSGENVDDEEENCEEDIELTSAPKPSSYLSKILSYVTKAPLFTNAPTNTTYGDIQTTLPSSTIFSSVVNNFMTTLSSGSIITTPALANDLVNTSTTNSLRENSTTPLSANISANTSTTNSLRENPTTTPLSANISANTSTTNSLRENPTTTPLSANNTVNTSTTTTQKSGFRNMRESFTTMAPETKNPEVYNISGNFTYDEAPLVCAAYGASLANYDQIEDAYVNGGEWCNYGWSENQTAYFPIQKETWNKLQKHNDPNLKNRCGRQGINGGYAKDPTKQMGINCFGIKPPNTNNDNALLQYNQSKILAKTQEDIDLENKIQYWKQQIDNGDVKINYYNEELWSEFGNNDTVNSDVDNIYQTTNVNTQTTAAANNVNVTTTKK
jgi:hypothetical protein